MEKMISGRRVIFDESDAEVIESWPWRIWSKGYVAYRVRDEDGRIPVVLLHRLLTGARPGEFVDHVNGNPLDNRRQNLRICTHAENMRNRRRPKHNTSGFKGVYASGRRWRAEIVFEGARYRLGSYATPEEASAAYAVAAVKLHGEFARAA